MRGGTLKRQSLVFEGKALRSRGDDGGVFEVNQDPLSSEENNCREPQRDKARKHMRHLSTAGGTHDEQSKLLSRLDAAIEFTSLVRQAMASSSLWQRFQRYFLEYRELGFSLDISRMKFPEDMFDKMRPQIEQAFAAMRQLEAGGIANPTEKRMVGHYWLRNPALAPTPAIRAEIEDTIQHIKRFAEDVHSGKILAENGQRFEHVLHIGIGGSALGPQFVSDALGSAQNRMNIFF